MAGNRKGKIPGVEVKRDKNGRVTQYKFRCCVGRDALGKQIWRTTSIDADDPRLVDLTPARLRDQLNTLKHLWDQEVKKQYDNGTAEIMKVRNKISFPEFVENHWIPVYVKDGKHTPNSIQFYEYTIATSKKFFHDKKLQQVNAEQVKKYLNYLAKDAVTSKGKPLSSTTQMHHWRTFSTVMGYAYRMGYIDENPCTRIGVNETPKRARHEIDYLKPEDARRWLFCIDSEYQEAVKKGKIGAICQAAKWRCYHYLSITTGLRRGELVAVTWGDLSEEKLSLNICKSACIDKTKEDKILIKTTKTGENRFVPVLAPVMEMLKEYKTLLEKTAHRSIAPGDYIFCKDGDPKTILYPTTPTRQVKKFVERHDLPDISPHDLRHSAASLAISNGAGLMEVSELMGHRDIQVTKRFYAALTAEAKRRTVQGIGEVLFGSGTAEKEQKDQILEAS